MTDIFLIWKIWANASASYIIWVCDKRKLRISSENRFGKILATLEKIKRLWPLFEVWLSIWQNFVSTLANIFMLSCNFSWFLMAKHRLNNLAIWSYCILFVLCFAKALDWWKIVMWLNLTNVFIIWPLAWLH